MKHSKFSQRRRQVMVMGAGAWAAPAVVMAAPELARRWAPTADRIIVSGRILGASAGQPLAGAQVEIWQADACGVRAEHTCVVVTADGDGRYFASLNGTAPRLHYRVSHQGYTARVTQMHATGTPQRSVSLIRDEAGATRAAFELTLTPRHALASAAPDTIAL